MRHKPKPIQGPQNSELYTVPRYVSVADRFADPALRGIEDASYTAEDIDLYAEVEDRERSLKAELDSMVAGGVLDKEYGPRIDDAKYFWDLPELKDELEELRNFTTKNFDCRLIKLRKDWNENYLKELEGKSLELLFYIS